MTLKWRKPTGSELEADGIGDALQETARRLGERGCYRQRRRFYFE